jgi:hypothetical protein
MASSQSCQLLNPNRLKSVSLVFLEILGPANGARRKRCEFRVKDFRFILILTFP